MITNILETLAMKPRFDLALNDLVNDLPPEMWESFINSDSASLKLLMPNSNISADRTTIFTL